MWDVFWLNFHVDFPRNWEKLVFVIRFGRFSLLAGCAVLLCFPPPPPALCHGWSPYLVFLGGSDSGVLSGNFFGRTGMQRLGPGIFEGCACLASDFDVSSGEI